MYKIVNNSLVYRIADDKLIAPAQSSDDPDYVAYIVWINQGNTPIHETISVLVPGQKKITKLAFRNRLGTAAKLQIQLLSVSVPTDPIEKQQLAATLRVYMNDLADATHVDLERADTIAGVNALVQLGIINQAKADSILNDPVQDIERWNG